MQKETKQRQTRKKLYNLHSWVGFQLSFVMFIILATGTIATLSNEIDWLVFSEMRTFNAPNKEERQVSKQDWVDMYAALKEYAPNDKITVISSMENDFFTYRARIIRKDGKQRYVHVDQWTKEVTGDIPVLTVQRFFRDFHRYLFMTSFPGLPVVTFFAFILAISLYTGLKTTRNWKTALWRLRIKQGPRILLSDLHKVAGLWGIWFVTLMVVTSLWYLFEFGVAVSGNRLESPRPKLAPFAEFEQGNFIKKERFSQAFEVAQSTLGDWRITTIGFPVRNTSPLIFLGFGANPLLRERAHKVELHPVTLDILTQQRPEDLSIGGYLNEYADPLHFGTFGGLWTKLIWFVFGLGLTIMSITGVLMTWKRVKSKKATKMQLATLPIFAISLFYFIRWVGRFI